MALPSSGPLSINDIAGEFGGSTPHAMSEYYAGGGLVPAGTSGTYGAVPSSGTISIQNFYGTSNFVPVYIEDVFSTWLYNGNGSTQTITNGIDLAGKGGLVWIKGRTGVAPDHLLFDTARGATNALVTNGSGVTFTNANTLSAFNASGFSVGSYVYVNGGPGGAPTFPETFVSWTFREQPKFFDVVTYTGTGSARTVAHNLGSVPGCIIIKRLNSTGEWQVFHRSTGNTKALFLNGTSPGDTAGQYWNNTSPTSTEFTVGFGPDANANGSTYVAYLFAHDAGGFGATGTDNVITCGTFTTDGSGNATVNLGYEPQWVLWKSSSNSSSWNIADNMRGFTASGPGGRILNPNNSNAEGNSSGQGINSTGFSLIGSNANWTWIYVAIRRGPMKTPTTGTSVFEPVAATQGLNASTPANSSILDDAFISSGRTTATVQFNVGDRLRGSPFFFTQGTDAETSGFYSWARQTGVEFTANLTTSGSLIMYHFRRAPGFFDVVCYTGVGGTLTVNHNLGAVPQLMIMKRRDTSGNWSCYSATTGVNQVIELNGAFGAQAASFWGTGPTSTTFQVASNVNTGNTFVAYLFATVAGVSKVGSYTGTGALQTINCGFTGGARFVLIKRTDDNSSGTANWYVYDSARGISSGNDPYLFMNSTAAEVTGTNFVDTTSVGFQVTAAAPAALNANGGTFIFLAIA
jgi:hypothetical protein